MFARWAVAVLCAVLVLVGCAGETINIVADPIFTGESGECRTRIRGLANALSIYSTDYDDQAPMANWGEAIAPYLSTHPEYMSCPGLHSSDLSQSGYALNQEVIGRSWTSFPNRSTVVVFYETADVTPGISGDPADRLTASRHAGSIFRVYADGYLENIGD